MSTENETWGDYSKLVLKELERLNDNYERMREDIDIRFKEMNNVLSDFKNTEKIVLDQKNWIEKVNDVWSPAQMKEAKDELYKQKNKWVATIAIITFVQFLIGIFIVFFKNLTD
jgi:frataxin-like iron-binding protein CyaY